MFSYYNYVLYNQVAVVATYKRCFFVRFELKKSYLKRLETLF